MDGSRIVQKSCLCCRKTECTVTVNGGAVVTVGARYGSRISWKLYRQPDILMRKSLLISVCPVICEQFTKLSCRLWENPHPHQVGREKMTPTSTADSETTMNYIEDHRIDSLDIRGGWVVVLIANLALVILAL